ncbi:MAG: hypothetical protein H6Q04_531 [Acidobacteria bacterium]|nr:hypothetical protein [Acidobacteriota bacterium]
MPRKGRKILFLCILGVTAVKPFIFFLCGLSVLCDTAVHFLNGFYGIGSQHEI